MLFSNLKRCKKHCAMPCTIQKPGLLLLERIELSMYFPIIGTYNKE